jgi:dihydrofolate reductase
MAKLLYFAITSLDGFVEDEHGRFGWAKPDAEVHAFANDLVRPIGTYLYGRRMYETMVWWETIDTGPTQDAPARDDAEMWRAVVSDYAELWRAADKIVYSRTLEGVASARTRIEREFDPNAIRALKRKATADIAVGCSELAGQALAAGLVDELHLLLNPIVVGGGKPAFLDRVWAELDLIGERRFQGGVVHVGYRVTAAAAAPTG